jgi:hypothetical protein
MKTKKQQPAILLLSALVLLPIIVFMGNGLLKVENPDLARVEFFVS